MWLAVGFSCLGVSWHFAAATNSFSAGSKKLGKAFISIGTTADGKVANDPAYRGEYDPSDKGARGAIE